MKTIVGKRIKEIRKDNYMSQQQFGEKLSVSQDTVSLWERGVSYPPTEIVIAIAKIFSVSSDYVLGLSDFWFLCKIKGLSTLIALYILSDFGCFIYLYMRFAIFRRLVCVSLR